MTEGLVQYAFHNAFHFIVTAATFAPGNAANGWNQEAVEYQLESKRDGHD
jgi:hypothetical protein